MRPNCPTCNGDGIIYLPNQTYKDCPQCNGQGRFREGEQRYFILTEYDAERLVAALDQRPGCPYQIINRFKECDSLTAKEIVSIFKQN